jgi:hypothetical protein
MNPTYAGPGIEFDLASYDPMRIMPVRHTLMGHPLLQLSSLLALAKRLEPTGGVRYHNGQATAATNFSTAPETHKAALSVEETLRRIEDANAWMALHNVQNDPLYRSLVDEVLDCVRPMIEPKDPGMHHRAGWIFVTSPGAVTPYHMDHENNFILQVHGKKTINVWDPLDRDVVTERSLELFHAKHSRELVVYKEEFQPRAKVFHVEPGMGGYMPTTSPHWVKNGDGVSITVSFTYYTNETRRRQLLHRGNYGLRSVGLKPEPVGDSQVRDRVKAVGFRAYQGGKDLVKRALGRPVTPTDVAYGIL